MINRNADLDARILVELQEMWHRRLGVSPKVLVPQPETTLAELTRSFPSDALFGLIKNELDLDDVWFIIETVFGLSIQQSDWFSLFGGPWKNGQEDEWDRFQDEWTVQRLIDFIRERLPVASFDTLNICAKDCAPAGIFLGLKTVAQSICGDDSEIAPSTPIIDRIKGLRLQRFWNQARLLTTLELPHAKGRFTYSFIALFLIFMAGIVQSVFSLHFSLPAIFAVAIAIFSYGCFRAANDTTTDDGALLERFAFTCRVPKQFHTFRDLAEYIANHRTTA